jgi:DNA-binding transcriptional ArsR family regulator
MVNKKSIALDETFGMLADATRRGILERLARGGARVTELAEPFAMSLPAISRHLRVLEEAGLVRRTRMGREHHLELEPAPIKAAVRWMEQYRRFWEGSLDRLADYLEQEQKGKPKKRRRRRRS